MPRQKPAMNQSDSFFPADKVSLCWEIKTDELQECYFSRQPDVIETTSSSCCPASPWCQNLSLLPASPGWLPVTTRPIEVAMILLFPIETSKPVHFQRQWGKRQNRERHHEQDQLSLNSGWRAGKECDVATTTAQVHINTLRFPLATA